MTSKWETVRLGEIALINPKTSGVSEDSPFITMSDVKEWGRWATTQGTKGSRGGVKAVGSDVLVARITPCLENGKIAMVPSHHGPVGGSTEFIVLRGTERVSPEFLYLWASERGTHSSAVRLMVGSTGRQRVSAKDYADLPIALPPMPEQLRIVDLIGALDDAIEAAEDRVDDLRRTLHTLRDKLIGRAAGDSLTGAEAFEITMGRQRAPKYEDGDGQTDYLRSANVGQGFLNLSDIKMMAFSDTERVKYGLRDGDVLVTEGSGSFDTVGASAQWNSELDGPVCFQNTLLRFRSLPSITTPEFTYQWCQWAFESGKFLAVANGTNIKHIGAKRAERMEVVVPPVDKQIEIASTLSALQRSCEVSNEHAKALRSLRTELLTALLSGAHEIPESYDSVMELAGA